MVPFAIAGPHGMSWALHRQLDRPLQVESLGAVFFAAAHEIAGIHLHVVKSAGSDNLVGSGPHLAATISGIVTFLAVLAVYVLYARSERHARATRDGIRRCGDRLHRVLEGVLAAIPRVAHPARAAGRRANAGCVRASLLLVNRS